MQFDASIDTEIPLTLLKSCKYLRILCFEFLSGTASEMMVSVIDAVYLAKGSQFTLNFAIEYFRNRGMGLIVEKLS